MQGKASSEGSTAAAAEGSQLYSQLLRQAEQQGADAARRWEELKQVRLTKGEAVLCEARGGIGIHGIYKSML